MQLLGVSWSLATNYAGLWLLREKEEPDGQGNARRRWVACSISLKKRGKKKKLFGATLLLVVRGEMGRMVVRKKVFR